MERAFPEAEFRIEFFMGSDHLPLFLCLDGRTVRKRRGKIFRYEAS